MLTFKDQTEAIDEPRTARMEQRTKPHVKAAIQQASALMGIDETAFVVSSAYEKAVQTIESYRRTLLSEADAKVFLAALDAPPKPNEALKELFELHRRRIVDG